MGALLHGRIALVTGASRGIGRALCHRPAAECTGLTAYSLHYPHHHRLPVYTLDGRERIADPELPAYSHPEIVASGLGA